MLCCTTSLLALFVTHYFLLCSLQVLTHLVQVDSQHLQELWGGPKYESEEGTALLTVLDVYFFFYLHSFTIAFGLGKNMW